MNFFPAETIMVIPLLIFFDFWPFLNPIEAEISVSGILLSFFYRFHPMKILSFIEISLGHPKFGLSINGNSIFLRVYTRKANLLYRIYIFLFGFAVCRVQKLIFVWFAISQYFL